MDHKEIREFLQQFKYSETEINSLYEILIKEGFYSLENLKKNLDSENDLKAIGICQFEKRRAIYKALGKHIQILVC